MGDLTALTTFLDDDGGFTTPPIPSTAYPEGHTYRVPSPDARTGLRLAALADLALKYHGKAEVVEADVKRLHLDDKDERTFIHQVLTTEVAEQMADDGCKWEHLRRIAQYGYIYFTAGSEAADRALEAGILQGKVPARNRAAKRSKKQGGASATTSASHGSKKRH